MKKWYASLLLFLGMILTPLFAEAHVKWFTKLTPAKEPLEKILSPLFMGVSFGVAVLLALLTQVLPIIMKWKPLEKADHFLEGFRKYSRYILKYGTAAALLIQVSSGTIFAPELHLHTELIIYFVWATIILLIVPHHYSTKAGALILLGIFIKITAEYGPFHMLDYGFYLAIIFVLLIGSTKIERWGFPFLYLGTGLSLCWVAVEKWVYPVMTIDIIQHHGVPTFGYDPSTFIVLSAFIEFVVGYLLVVGVLNRVLAIVLTGIFIMTTTIFGGVELSGHFIIHIILVIFIIEGVSFYNPPINLHKTRLDQVIFVFLNFLFVLSAYLLIYYRFA